MSTEARALPYKKAALPAQGLKSKPQQHDNKEQQQEARTRNERKDTEQKIAQQAAVAERRLQTGVIVMVWVDRPCRRKQPHDRSIRLSYDLRRMSLCRREKRLAASPRWTSRSASC